MDLLFLRHRGWQEVPSHFLVISVQNYPYILSCYFHFLPSPVPSFSSSMGSVGGWKTLMWNLFDSFYGISIFTLFFKTWHFPLWSLQVYTLISMDFFSCWGVEVQTRKYDMTLSSRTHFYRHIKMFCCNAPPVKVFLWTCKKKDRSGKNKKSASLERLKCHYSISVVLFRGEFRARYCHTRNFLLFTFSGFHPILDALFTSEWGSRRLGYGIKIWK